MQNTENIGPGNEKYVVVMEARTTFANMGRLHTRNSAVNITTVIDAWKKDFLFVLFGFSTLSEGVRLIFEADMSFKTVTKKLTKVRAEIRSMLVASKKY